jgi:peptidoglycan biosynthesis protein MviN/MurJ (putative lipid II flippase)
VLIRSAVATFYARKDTATPVKAALIGVAANVALKIALVGALAQVGLALATAVGAWINLLLVTGFAVRSGFLDLDKALTRLGIAHTFEQFEGDHGNRMAARFLSHLLPFFSKQLK